MEIGKHLDARQFLELLPIPFHRFRYFAADFEPPAFRGYVGRSAGIEYWPLTRPRLPRWHPHPAPRIRTHDHLRRQTLRAPYRLLLRFGIFDSEHISSLLRVG